MITFIAWIKAMVFAVAAMIGLACATIIIVVLVILLYGAYLYLRSEVF
jgi:hypothetical protein